MIEAMVHRSPLPSHPWMEEALPPVELSIEVFPPKGPEAAARLWFNVEQFVAIRPRFISVTCGAGGSGAEGTLPLVRGIQDTFAVPVAAHMTCAWSSRRGDRRAGGGVLGPWRPPDRGTARRSPQGCRPLRAAPRRLCLCVRSDPWPQGGGRVRDQRRLLPGSAPRGGECRGRSRQCPPQGRGRRHPAGDAVLLRHRQHPALPRPAGRRRDRGRVRARHHADPQLQPDPSLLPRLRRRRPRLARAAVRRASRRIPRCTA